MTATIMDALIIATMTDGSMATAMTLSALTSPIGRPESPLRLFSLLLSLFQPHPRTSAVLVDEPSILGTLFACNVRVTTGIGIAVLIF
jgi:hypothetical protein